MLRSVDWLSVSHVSRQYIGTIFMDHAVLNCFTINPLNAKLNPICHLLPLLGAHHILRVSKISVEDGTERVYETSVPNYQSTLRNTPEEQRSQLLRSSTN